MEMEMVFHVDGGYGYELETEETEEAEMDEDNGVFLDDLNLADRLRAIGIGGDDPLDINIDADGLVDEMRRVMAIFDEVSEPEARAYGMRFVQGMIHVRCAREGMESFYTYADHDRLRVVIIRYRAGTWIADKAEREGFNVV